VIYLCVAEEEDHGRAVNACFHHGFLQVFSPLVVPVVLGQLDLETLVLTPESRGTTCTNINLHLKMKTTTFRLCFHTLLNMLESYKQALD
jgi:hypothetical protein